MIIKLTISYDGTNYCGWQVQPNGLSVQQVLEDALFAVTGEKIKVTGSGRTDAGVHAKGQVAHFERQKENIPAEKYAKALNAHLPPDIKVLKSEKAEENFNACKSAKRKTYEYKFYFSETELPLKERYAVHLSTKPDMAFVEECAKIFVGEHDFKCFCASGSSVKTTVRTIYNINVKETDGEIIFSVTGNGFLYNMVRSLVGTLLDAGYKRIEKEQLIDMLDKKERSLIGKTLPAKGLCLVEVLY